MNKWKIAGGAVTLGVAALVLSACSSSATSKTPSILLDDSITTMDQSTVLDADSMNVVNAVEAGLTRLDNDQATLDLAKSIQTSADGKTLTIELRPNLKWSNGDKLTAQDFVYSWRRGDAPKTASQYAYMLAYVKNGDAVNQGKMPASALGVKALSDTTLQVQLENPTPYMKEIMTLPIYFPEDPKVVEKYGKSYGTTTDKMAYDGPFQFKKAAANGWNGSNNNYTVVKNPSYWDKKDVKSAEINFQVVKQKTTAYNLYKEKKISFATVDTPNLYKESKGNKDFRNDPISETEYIEMNQSGKGASSPIVNKALLNKNIRAALTLATDRKGVTSAAFPAYKPATSFTPTGTGEINGQDFTEYAKQNNYRYDPAAAKVYFEKGLKELGVSKLSLNFEVSSDVTEGKDYADYLQKAYEKALPGLTVNEKLVPFKQLLNDAHAGNFDMIDNIWIADYTDPSTYLQMFTAGSEENNGRFVNAAYDADMKKADTVPDVLNKKAYYADYKQAETDLANGYNVNPVMFYTHPQLVSPNLKGVVWNSTGLYDLKKAHVI